MRSEVALKIVRNERQLIRPTQDEIDILERLNTRDPVDRLNIVRLLEHFAFRGHICMVVDVEPLSIDLYEMRKRKHFAGFSVPFVAHLAHAIYTMPKNTETDVSCACWPEARKHPSNKQLQLSQSDRLWSEFWWERADASYGIHATSVCPSTGSDAGLQDWMSDRHVKLRMRARRDGEWNFTVRRLRLSRIRGVVVAISHQHQKDSWHIWRHLRKDTVFICNFRCRSIFLHGCSRTYRVASLRAGPVGRISYNLYYFVNMCGTLLVI